MEVSKCNPQARRMADRHYSYRPLKGRQRGPEVGPPGQKIVLLTEDGKALWGSHRPAPWTGLKRADGIDAWCCFIFRNEGYPGAKSSVLIQEAVARTVQKWGIAPQGFITYVAQAHIQSTNPGWCYLQAGWEHDTWVWSAKLGWLRRLLLSPEKCGGA